MSYHKERWIYIWPQSGPAPQFVMSQCLTSLPPLHPRPLWPRPDETGWNGVYRFGTWTRSRFWVVQRCSLINVRQDVLYRRRCLHGMDLMLVSKAFLLLRPRYRFYRTTESTIKQKEKSPIFVLLLLPLFFPFYTFLSFFFCHFHTFITVEYEKKKKRKWRNQNFRSLVRFSSAGFSGRQFRALLNGRET